MFPFIKYMRLRLNKAARNMLIIIVTAVALGFILRYFTNRDNLTADSKILEITPDGDVYSRRFGDYSDGIEQRLNDSEQATGLYSGRLDQVETNNENNLKEITQLQGQVASVASGMRDHNDRINDMALTSTAQLAGLQNKVSDLEATRLRVGSYGRLKIQTDPNTGMAFASIGVAPVPNTGGIELQPA